jgi:hypothetical protein
VLREARAEIPPVALRDPQAQEAIVVPYSAANPLLRVFSLMVFTFMNCWR